MSVAGRYLRGAFCVPTGPPEAGLSDGSPCAEERRHDVRFSTGSAQIPEVTSLQPLRQPLPIRAVLPPLFRRPFADCRWRTCPTASRTSRTPCATVDGLALDHGAPDLDPPGRSSVHGS